MEPNLFHREDYYWARMTKALVHMFDKESVDLGDLQDWIVEFQAEKKTPKVPPARPRPSKIESTESTDSVEEIEEEPRVDGMSARGAREKAQWLDILGIKINDRTDSTEDNSTV